MDHERGGEGGKFRRQVELGGRVPDPAHEGSSSVGRWVLGGLGILVLVQAYLLSRVVAGLVVTFTGGVGLVFLLLAWPAKQRPVPALGAGLAVHVGLFALDSLLAPENVTRGIFLRALIVITLVGALAIQKLWAGRK